MASIGSYGNSRLKEPHPMSKKKFIQIVILFVLVFQVHLSRAEDLEIGKDRRTDGVSLSFETANQYANLFTGAATYSIPIEVPAGPGGFSPSVALYYNSDQGNGWLGLGWHISGLHRIERSTKYGIPNYFDPVPSGEYFAPQNFDRFDLYLHGNHYELFYDFNSKKYVTNPHGHFKISHFSNANGVYRWKIIDASGIEYTFDGIQAVGRSGYRFYPINQEMDPHGNLILYKYEIDTKNGDYYPKEIKYGLNKNLAYFIYAKNIYLSIIFELEKRKIVGSSKTEEISNFKGGSDMVMDQRIKRIVVMSPPSKTTGEPWKPYPTIPQGVIKDYELKYTATIRGHQSLLSEVRIKGLGADYLGYKFSYQGQSSSEEGFQEIINKEAGNKSIKGVPDLWPLKSARGAKSERGELFPGVRWVDVDGDALVDMVWGLNNKNLQWNSNRVGGKAIAQKSLSWTPIENSIQYYNGSLDKIFYDYKGFPAPISRWPSKDWGSLAYHGAFAGTELLDVDHDGFVDIIHSFDDGSVTKLTWINENGESWKLDSAWSLPEVFTSFNWSYSGKYGSKMMSKINNIKIVDVNGDGFPDIVSADKGTFLNKGAYGQKGWEANPNPIWKTPASSFGYFGVITGDQTPHYIDLGVRYVDLNGDGLNDVLIYRNPKCILEKLDQNTYKMLCNQMVVETWINTGYLQQNGTVCRKAVKNWQVPINPYLMGVFTLGSNLWGSNLGTQLLDINLDGLPDLVYSLRAGSNSTKVVAFNTGNGWGIPVTSNPFKSSDPNAWVDKLPDFAVSIPGLTETIFEDNGVSFADFNGDGAPDIGQSRYYYQSQSNFDEFNFVKRRIGVWYNKFEAPLLSKAETPYGGTIEFQYKASHSDGAHKNHQDVNGVNRMPSPKQVVWSIKMSDGIRNQVETQFGYQGGLFDFENREFRGFRSVIVLPGGSGSKDFNTRQITYIFFQDDARKGQIASIRDGSKRVFSETFNIYKTNEVGKDKKGKAYETLLASTYHLNYDYLEPEQDLLYDLNFNNINEPQYQLSCNGLSYNPFPSAKSPNLDYCSGIVTAMANTKSHSFGGYAYYGLINIPLSGYSFPSLSIQVWISPDPNPQSGSAYYASDQIIAEKYDAFKLYLDKNDNYLKAKIYIGKQWHTIDSSYKIPTNEFSHISFTYDGKTAKLYVNGKLQTEKYITGPMNKGGNLVIGAVSAPAFGYPFVYMDEFKIFKNVVKVPKITKISYTYDQYGNISDIFSYGDLGDSMDDFVTHTDYDYKTASYIMNLPKYIYRRESGSFTNSKIKSAVWYDYDNKGNLIKEESWGGVRDYTGKPISGEKTNPVIAYQYDIYGNLTQIEDPLGGKSSLTYNLSFPVNPTIIKNALGHSTTIDYYGVGDTEKDYDRYLGLFGQIKRITNPNGSSTRFVYDRYGRIRAIYGPNDGDIEQGYLYPSRLYSYERYKLPSAPDKESEYKFQSIRILARNKNLKEKQTYLWAFSDNLKLGKETSINTFSESNTVSGSFDENYLCGGAFPGSFPKQPGDFSSNVLSSLIYFDGFGRPFESISEAEGDDIAIISGIAKFDGLGREKEIYKPYFIANKLLYETYGLSSKSLSLDLICQNHNFNQPKVSKQYDEIGRLVKITGPDGAMTTFEYDQWKVTAIDPNGHKKIYHNDAYGRLIKVEEFEGEFGEQAKQKPKMIAAVYDKTSVWVQNPAEIYKVIKEKLTKGSSKDQQPFVITGFILLKMPYTTEYKYNLLGNLIAIKDPNGNEITFEYDTLGRKIKMTDPDMGGNGGKFWEYKYNLSGNLIEIIDAKGQYIGFEYDKLDRLIKKSYYQIEQITVKPTKYSYGGTVVHKTDIQPPVTWQYDDTKIGGPYSIGRMVKMSDSSGSTEYRYDNEGRVIEIVKTIDEKKYITKFTYDAMGRIKSIAYPDKEVLNYKYGRDGYINTVQIHNGAHIIKNTLFDTVGNLRRMTFGNDIETRYDYNDDSSGNQLLNSIQTGTFATLKVKTPGIPNWKDGKITSSELWYIQEVAHSIQYLKYQYDLKGNITKREDMLDSKYTMEYQYDEFDRLISLSNDDIDLDYNYDSLGNMILMADKTHKYEKKGWAGPHAVTRIIPASEGSKPFEINYTYDANGNITDVNDANDGDVKYSYDYENHLTGINKETTFVYDGYGNRVKKVEDTKSISLYPFPFFEIENNKIIKYYVANGMVIAKRDSRNSNSDELLFYHPDQLGSLNVMTNSEGKYAGQIEYYPYGEVMTESGSKLLGKYKFTGKELDTSGLYYFGARYYDPKTGKFITPDPLDAHVRELGMGNSQNLNLYSYVLNNPVNFIDVYGLQRSQNEELGLPTRFIPGVWGEELFLSEQPSAPREHELPSMVWVEGHAETLINPGDISTCSLISQYLQASGKDPWLAWRKSALDRIRKDFYDIPLARTEHYLLRFALASDELHNMIQDLKEFDKLYHPIRTFFCKQGLCKNDPSLPKWENTGYKHGEYNALYRNIDRLFQRPLITKKQREIRAYQFMIETTDMALISLEVNNKAWIERINFLLVRDKLKEKIGK